MVERKLSAVLAMVPGLILLFVMRPSKFPWVAFGALLAWFLLVVAISYRRRRVPDWGMPALGLIFPILGIASMYLSISVFHGAGMLFRVAPWGIALLISAVVVIVWGAHLAMEERLGKALPVSLAVLAAGISLEVLSTWLAALNSHTAMPPLADVLRFWLAGAAVEDLGLASLALLFVLTAWYLAPDRPHLALGLMGVAGFFLWSFWLEFDYAIAGTGYASLIGLWFVFWLAIVLPALSVTEPARRHPLTVLAVVLVVAFGGMAIMDAFVRVHPTTLRGLLAILHLPEKAHAATSAGVGSLADQSLPLVMLQILAQYLSVAATAVAGYVFAVGGYTVDMPEEQAPATDR